MDPFSIKMDYDFSESDERRYIAWLYSPTVFSDTPGETILAYKISKIFHMSPSGTLRALRGIPGQNPDIVQKVEEFVAKNESV